MLQNSFDHLTPEEIRFRFLHPITELTPERARSLTDLDPGKALALVAVELLPPDEAWIEAVARAVIDKSGDHAEFAIIVWHRIAGQGLGRHLLLRLCEWCRKKRLRSIYGNVMIENERMLGLARQTGFQCSYRSDEPGTVLIRKLLTGHRSGPAEHGCDA